jgi:hypothetical protein
MKMWPYTLLTCLFVSGCSFSPSAGPAATNSPIPTAGAEQQLQEVWKRLDQGTPPANKLPISWRPAYSVLFPNEWPPTSATIWVRYAYAQGMDMDLHDGVRVSAPWARLELRGNLDTVTIVPLSNRLEPVTIQGVTPIDAATQAVLAKGDEVSAYCLQLTALPQPNSPPAADMRAFYQTWLKYNGALVKLIQPNHEKFLAWLNE